MKSWIILLMTFGLLLGGCGVSSESPKPEAKETSSPAETIAPLFSDDSRIEQLRKADTYVSQEGEVSYDFRIPQILGDSASVRTFNESIRALLPREGTLPAYKKITWESHWNGSLLSLILKMQHAHCAQTDYRTFHYDFSLDRSLSREELALHFSMNEADLLNALCFTAATCFDEAHKDLDPDFREGLWDLRAQTISRQNLSSAPLFVDDTAVLSVILTMATPAGGGYEYVASQLKTPAPMEAKTSDSFANAMLKDGKVTLTFHETDFSLWTVGPEFLPHDVPVSVDRLYGNYEKMAIGNVAAEFWPMLILLDENGQISFVDLMQYDQETGSFHGVGPIACSAPVADFSHTELYGTEVLCGVDRDGNKVEFYGPLYDAADSLSPYLYASDYLSADDVYSLTFPRDNNREDLVFSGGGRIGTGRMYCAGMDPEGWHYAYSLYEEDQTVYGSISEIFPAPGTGDLPWLILRNASDRSMAGLPARSQMELYWGHP